MKFRPCIDIHNGIVKQIVGSSLNDDGTGLKSNFEADKGADYFASLYKEHNLSGGHIIILNKVGSEEYELSKKAAAEALRAYPGGMQIGGGINADNAMEFINMGASHVIVTSYVFKDGQIDYEALGKISKAVGREHLCLDLSCKRVEDDYLVATDRWQKLTDVKVTVALLEELSKYASEFLIHAADVEGKRGGVEKELLKRLSTFKTVPLTYAGGVSEYSDIELINELGQKNLDFTVGSALDLFGGKLLFEKIVEVSSIL